MQEVFNRTTDSLAAKRSGTKLLRRREIEPMALLS